MKGILELFIFLIIPGSILLASLILKKKNIYLLFFYY